MNNSYLYVLVRVKYTDSYDVMGIATSYQQVQLLTEKILAPAEIGTIVAVYQAPINDIKPERLVVEFTKRIGVIEIRENEKILNSCGELWEFTIQLLEKDPLAIDAVKDVLKS